MPRAFTTRVLNHSKAIFSILNHKNHALAKMSYLKKNCHPATVNFHDFMVVGCGGWFFVMIVFIILMNCLYYYK